MIGKRDESFVAKEDIPLILLDIDRARRKLLPQQKTADYHSMDGRGSTPAGLGETASQHRNFPVEGSAAGAGEAGTRTASDFPTLQERDDTGGHLEGFRAKGPSLAGGENDYSVGKVTRHLRYRRILANGEKVATTKQKLSSRLLVRGGLINCFRCQPYNNRRGFLASDFIPAKLIG